MVANSRHGRSFHRWPRVWCEPGRPRYGPYWLVTTQSFVPRLYSIVSRPSRLEVTRRTRGENWNKTGDPEPCDPDTTLVVGSTTDFTKITPSKEVTELLFVDRRRQGTIRLVYQRPGVGTIREGLYGKVRNVVPVRLLKDLENSGRT